MIDGESSKYVRVGDEGSKVTFGFCPKCGSTVYYAVEGYDQENIAIPVGAFADPGFPVPTFSVYEERMHSGVGLPAVLAHVVPAGVPSCFTTSRST